MSLPTRRLGKDGPEVFGLGLGLMSLGSAYGPAGSDKERLFFLDQACELGARNWDSADIYGDTEALLGKWFKRSGKRHDVFLSTKFGY
jgi:aryl-alcohol dehydrogenase-like predicted oxidoreductase